MKFDVLDPVEGTASNVSTLEEVWTLMVLSTLDVVSILEHLFHEIDVFDALEGRRGNESQLPQRLLILHRL